MLGTLAVAMPDAELKIGVGEKVVGLGFHEVEMREPETIHQSLLALHKEIHADKPSEEARDLGDSDDLDNDDEEPGDFALRLRFCVRAAAPH